MSFDAFGPLSPLLDFAYETIKSVSSFFDYLLNTSIGDLLNIFKDSDNFLASLLASIVDAILSGFTFVFDFSPDTPALLFFVALSLPLVLLYWTITFFLPLIK